ncbi:hypothetical protein [Sphingobacterium paludis]|uniref:Uncharacterized protein n=1 Tax=Sphingobacterium paludis TaxID=1476465 RepID=A0A4V3E1V5_9SPHI|nr:hypothetical protein [Sphingobacterium paludis]TDS14798.1 hypothetical protein B0I21_103298 [Sphingobacterium paludis]
MMAIQTDKIDAFIQHVSALLRTDFERKDAEHYLLLRAASLDLTLIVYLPGAGQRLPHATNRTIHVDYDQVILNADKLSARLASLFGNGQVVYARKTVAARVDKRVTLSFLAEHHLQGAVPGKYRYGLFHEGELLSIAVFSGGRRMRNQPEAYRSFELIRFCHKSNYRVVGGLSKLLKAFIDDFQPNDIMTYVDRDWAQDSNLSALGFQEVGVIPPQWYRISDGVRTAITDLEQREVQSENPSTAYLVCNAGSTKLVLSL